MAIQRSIVFAASACTRVFAGLTVFLVISMIHSGCGYHFAGAGGQPPGDIESIAIENLQNRTAEIGLETLFTNAILNQFIRWKRLEVRPKNEAEAVLGGSIYRIRTTDVSHLAPKETLETRVTVTLAVVLKKADSDDVLWQNPALSYFEEYVETGEALATNRLRREALSKIADFLAEKIHNDIFLDF
jgi:hypothetical protein